MVEAAAKTNSVTISTGIRLAAFFSSSFPSAPFSDWKSVSCSCRPIAGSKHFKCRTPIVHVRLQSAVVAEVQFVFKIIHLDASVENVTVGVR